MRATLSERIIDVRELSWSFDRRVGSYTMVGRGRGNRKREVPLYPAPAYAHDRGLVVDLLRDVEERFPLRWQCLTYLPSFDALDGTNGVTFEETLHGGPKDEEGREPVASTIVLFGKMTPIIPAMTSYLVGHEYGHAVAEDLAPMFHPGYEARLLLMRQYAELRGMGLGPVRGVANLETGHYGPGTWHLSAEEVFANDCRILMFGLEREFWPHPGIPRPEEVPSVVAWWEEQRQAALKRARAVPQDVR